MVIERERRKKQALSFVQEMKIKKFEKQNAKKVKIKQTHGNVRIVESYYFNKDSCLITFSC